MKIFLTEYLIIQLTVFTEHQLDISNMKDVMIQTQILSKVMYGFRNDKNVIQNKDRKCQKCK